MNVYAAVPVAQFEPESIITKSIECLKELECDNFNFKVYYLIDTFLGDKRTISWVLPNNFSIMLRTRRGHKAGALNDFLKMIEDADYPADYVAIIDVDCRPAKDFIQKCIAALEENDSAIFSSGCRFVKNKSNILTKLTAIEWFFLCNAAISAARSKSFLPLGATGVLKGSLLKGERFDEESLGEDLDLITRMYLKGVVAVLANTVSEEQVPTTLRDFYSQRVRCCRSQAETFSKYLIPMVQAPVPFTGKIFWLCSVISPFFTPFLSLFGLPWFLANLREKKLSGGPLESVKLLFGGVGYTWLMTIIGIVSIIQLLTSSKFEWGLHNRCDM